MKILSSLLLNLFSQLYDSLLNVGTSSPFIQKHLITDFQKTVKAVIKRTD